jgi:hypothetical protein
VHRFWVIACAAAMLLASGCLGSSSAAHAPAVASSPTVPAIVPALSYALFEVTGTYTTSGGGNHFTGRRHHEHFALACHSRNQYEVLSMLSPQDRLCFAILDYQSAPKKNTLCFCPVEFDVVTVRGNIHGRGINEQFTYCLCGVGRRAIEDTRVILTTHPPFRTGNGGT